MIEKMVNFSRVQTGNKTTIQFDRNRDIVGVEVILTDDFEEFKGKTVEFKYALNGVLTDLIHFGSAKISNDKTVKINLETPISAEYIFIITEDERLKIEDVEVYEYTNISKVGYYPAVFDTDLKENYYLDTVSVFTGLEGYSHYSVFTSINGRDFDLVAQKRNDKKCDFQKGDIYSLSRKEARIIRVFIEYNSASDKAEFNRVEFSGEKSNREILCRPAIEIENFENSPYDTEIKAEDTYAEIYGIIERRLGAEYKNRFILELKENPNGKKYDYFKLSDSGDRIKIEGNCGVSLAAGLNHYLKYYCKVNICQVGDNAVMPEKTVKICGEVYRETKAKIRYAYNYCTLSYSMAFWGEKEWRDEIDWLALNGVNLVLDITACEEVWRRFLTKLGYTHKEILKFISGPAYYAWAYMANISGFGGPVHDSWFARRTDLARKNHLIMRKLGICPVLQGYSGMVPGDINEHFENLQIIKQGEWGSLYRPDMLKTTSKDFHRLAEIFYKVQREVYGNYSHYYSTDPFHEGGNTGDMEPKDVSGNVLSAMMKSDKDAVWVIQSWQRNPTSEFLKGIELQENGREHALILDLYAEKLPNFSDGKPENPNHGYSKEFNSTPWVFCMLNNFGGRLGMHGHIDNLVNNIPKAFNTCKYIAGIGIAPEATGNNPVLYDFLFETVWQKNADEEMQEIDLNRWICDYAQRRYGKKSKAAEDAWKILLDTVYKAEFNSKGQGAPESIVNARPSLESRPASSWGNICVDYDKEKLKEAARLLLDDYETLKNSKGYMYDAVTVLQQILSNEAQDVHKQMAAAFESRNLKEFEKNAARFLKIADLMDTVTATNKYYMLGSWINAARRLAENTDDFTKMLYEMNAKALITTWGSLNQCEIAGLGDYSNRQWSGLISDYYKPRWEHWINERKKELRGEKAEEKTDWFKFEWSWVREIKNYADTPKNTDLPHLAKEIV
ncbi:MAG: alpha-N-acetylglucosaminidase [Clostridiales bacterium]|nr:alpha-N-acetylglucosaminidase [Candidatus Equinaster intestinalis]